VFFSFQKLRPEGTLDVEISRNGVSLKRQATQAPYGIVGLGSAPPASGPPRQTEFRVDGSVRLASLTMTSETGDTEQRLVPVPFTETFFPRAGWIVSLLAQKTRVERPDPQGHGILTESDGVGGTVHVSIIVNGTALDQAQSSEPYGVASATVRIP